MLQEYFALELREVPVRWTDLMTESVACQGKIHALPDLLDKYVPPLATLPMFLYRLAVEVRALCASACTRVLSRSFADAA